MYDPLLITRTPSILFPIFSHMLLEALKQTHAAGLPTAIFETYRSPTRQQYLYDQGRTRPGRIITNAKPGKSWHQYGLAVDLAFDGSRQDGIQWSWEGNWDAVGKIFTDVGLEWLGYSPTFPEKPHFQLTKGLTIDEACYLASQEGIIAVWLEIESRLK
jgi:peptidoglycan L-alanyl-D-glutamate endopeptidase CwlK